MDAKEICSGIFDTLRITQAKAAPYFGKSPKLFNDRIVRDSLRVSEFIDGLDKLGVDVKFIVRETGEEVSFFRKGYGRRVRQMVDRVIYDTEKADALSNNFYSDGENEYTDGRASELYVDRSGRYFFADYTTFAGVKDRITPVDENVARSFVDKYGNELYKK